MSFKEWYENADIPEKDKNGNWYDLETGLSYEPEKTERKYVSEKTKEIRKEVKKTGGKSLKGTLKQKEWAEKIRLDLFKKFNLEMTDFYSNLSNAQYAKFWIEFRDETVQELEKNMKEFLLILKEVNELNENIKNYYLIDEKKFITFHPDYKQKKKEIDDLIEKGNSIFLKK